MSSIKERGSQEKANAEFNERPVVDNESAQLYYDGLTYEETRRLEKRCKPYERLSNNRAGVFQVLRKINLHLTLPLFFLFIFNILDRSNIANAKLGGLHDDLGMTDTQFQTAVASYSGILAARLCLGIAESPFCPGALLMICSWYKPSEIAPRVAFMYCGNTIANGFGGLLAAGVLDGVDGTGGLAGWRWLYIIEGADTMIAGVLAYWLLPDFPWTEQESWLTAQEHCLAECQISMSANDESYKVGGVREGLKAALTDVKVWMLVLTQNMNLTAQTWIHFFPTCIVALDCFQKPTTLQSIVKALGFGTIVTLLITAPVCFFGFVTAMGNSFIAAKTDRRAILIVWPLLVGIAGNVMIISSTSTAVRYTGMFLMCAGSYSAFNVVQAWVASTIPRTRTKRSIAYALVNMFGNLSNVYGSYFFPNSDAPQYWWGGVILSSFAPGGSVCAAVLGTYRYVQHRNPAKLEEETGRPQYRDMI